MTHSSQILRVRPNTRFVRIGVPMQAERPQMSQFTSRAGIGRRCDKSKTPCQRNRLAIMRVLTCIRSGTGSSAPCCDGMPFFTSLRFFSKCRCPLFLIRAETTGNGEVNDWPGFHLSFDKSSNVRLIRSRPALGFTG